MASPGCRRWQHKGRTSTNPALKRDGRSRSALYRADMAMGNPAQWPFHALRAHPGLGSAHLSCRATWMLLDGAPSWRQRRWPQPVNEAQDLGEQRSWDGDLRHLESDIAAVAHDLGADLDQLLAQGGQRPMFHRLGQGQRPEEVADVVGQRKRLLSPLVECMLRTQDHGARGPAVFRRLASSPRVVRRPRSSAPKIIPDQLLDVRCYCCPGAPVW